MALSREEVRHIALLARVGVTEEEVERFREQLSNILENFQALQKVDTRDVPATGHAIEMKNVIRPDEIAASLSQDDALANAPRREGEFVRVRAVLEF
ncbi:MAG: Asp-tRNA(Asn)/Glu-tRNA(Gln) amidotransferase subunit GatC [Chloroflexi bacterium]|nr:Asp-tRNA(Asn)/Glu-tRNA(Gln) amidotransferase subunit GatC [Chloroflexota bacterium]